MALPRAFVASGPAGAGPATRVPPPSGDVIVQLPPSSSARSRMEAEADAAAGIVGQARPRCRRPRRGAPRGPANRHDAVARTAVPLGVVHRLDDDPVRRHLDGGGQPVELADGPDRPGHRVRVGHGSAARLCSSARCRSAGTRPSWSSAGGRSPSTRRRTSPMSALGLVGELADQVGGAVRVGADQLVGEVEVHRHAGQRRAEPVVEVPPDPAALLLAGRDEVLPGPLQLTVEGDGLDERADLAAHVLEQAPVAGAERVARRGPPPAGARRGPPRRRRGRWRSAARAAHRSTC